MTKKGQISEVCFFGFIKKDIANRNSCRYFELFGQQFTLLDLGVKSSINVDTFWDTNKLHLFYCFRITRGTF